MAPAGAMAGSAKGLARSLWAPSACASYALRRVMEHKSAYTVTTPTFVGVAVILSIVGARLPAARRATKIDRHGAQVGVIAPGSVPDAVLIGRCASVAGRRADEITMEFQITS